jgi:hypothetical protein
MTEQDLRDELHDLVWTMNDRIIIIAILGIFGFMILSFASMHSETFTQSDIDTINFVFRGVAALLSAYAVLPFFRFGLKNRGGNNRQGVCSWRSSSCDTCLPCLVTLCTRQCYE